MTAQPEFELRYNMTDGGCDTQQGTLYELMRATRHMVNLWEIRRPSDNALVYAEEVRECDCGTGKIMRGWRVCLACAETRLLYPDFWEPLLNEPDRIQGVEGVPKAFVVWDINGTLAGAFAHPPQDARPSAEAEGA